MQFSKLKEKATVLFLSCKEETTTSDIPGGEDLTKETSVRFPAGKSTLNMKLGLLKKVPFIIYPLNVI